MNSLVGYSASVIMEIGHLFEFTSSWEVVSRFETGLDNLEAEYLTFLGEERTWSTVSGFATSSQSNRGLLLAIYSLIIS